MVLYYPVAHIHPTRFFSLFHHSVQSELAFSLKYHSITSELGDYSSDQPYV